MKFYNFASGKLIVRELEHPTDELVPELVKALENCLYPMPTNDQLSRDQIVDILQKAQEYLQSLSDEPEESEEVIAHFG